MMKRLAVWAFYGIGLIAILYLALYAYVVLTGRPFEPGDPIHIFRKPNAPIYSQKRLRPVRVAAAALERPESWVPPI